MDVLAGTETLLQMIRWVLAMARHDTHYPAAVPENPKFMSPRQAVRLIRDRSVVAASGLGVHQRASILYWAMRDSFAESGHPRQLTMVNVGGHGSRGVLPGTLDELAHPGLCTRFITSHFETFHPFLELAAAGKCELQCLPLGIMALLFDALSRGKESVVTKTGVGTCLDPSSGHGSAIAGRGQQQLVSLDGRRLRYRLPPIDVALFNVPAADRRGNLYIRNCATQGDSYEIARAAKRNGGVVIANVGLVVDEGYDRVFLPANKVDAIVYYPNTEQTAGFFHRAPWPAVTVGSAMPIGDALGYAQLVQWLGGIAGGLARRTSVDDAVARLAAATLFANVERDADVVLGAGLPEEIARIVFEYGRLDDVTFLVETGVVGGLPAPGAYFGAAFSPRSIVSTTDLFKRCYRKLDAACLGALEVDGKGNVNVSKRGDGVRNYAGPGGFIDFTAAARVLVFISRWARHGDIVVEGNVLRQRQHGSPKFVEQVGEVTFNGREGLRAGKQVFYVTEVGVFRLTKRGMELVTVMPGIDVRRDILETTPIKIALPPGKIPIVSKSVVTGVRFKLPKRERTEGSGAGAIRSA